jgi:uncharacterized membrane protein
VDALEIGLLVLAVLLAGAGGSVGIAAARPGDDWRDTAARALGVVGATALGAGIVLFFAANWSDIARAGRFAILLGGLAVLLCAAFWLLEVRRERPNLAHGLVLVGAVVFGASIFLVGQTYHVSTHAPFAFLAWSAGALAIALFFRSSPTAGLAVLTFEGWLVFELVEYRDFEALALIPSALALYGVALYALGTAEWPWLTRLGLDGPMRTIGFALGAFAALALGFRYPHFARHPPEGTPLAIIVATAVVALVAAAALTLQRRGVMLLEPALAAAAAVLALLSAVAPEHVRSEEFSFGAKAYPLLYIALLIGIVAGAVVLGSLQRQLWLSSAAILIGVLAIVLHFVDVSWHRLPRSAVFAGVGLLTIGLAAALERRKRAT